MKRMLINATQKEEFRVALVDGQKLFELDIETPDNDQQKSNIYKGIITTISPSLDAAFVSYGGEKDGFLAMKDVAREYFPKDYVFNGKPSIKDALYEGQEIIVQINKDIRGNKGAALTTYISLAGSYLVLMPNNPRAGGISRRIEGDDRVQLKKALASLEVPKGMGLIIRTACLGKTTEELDADLKTLLRYWDAIKIESTARKGAFLIHKESDILTRSFRDHLRPDIGEILIDNKGVLDVAKKRITSLGRLEYLNRLKLYTGEVSLFSHYQIESQIEAAFRREVRLPSGGSIVIDTTEALTAIDINSAKSTRGSDIEDTAFHTNLEAADEIAKQLRLRDLGGLIVIDFIDMTPIEHHRQVEMRFKEAVKNDRARIQMTKLSRFGLLELSRQRLHPSLRESTHHICPRCSGTGIIRDDDSLALSILRVIGEEALKEKTSRVQAIVPVRIASYLLNEKRMEISRVEKESNVVVIIAPDSQMETPDYKIMRIRSGEESNTLSYMLPQLHHNTEKIEITDTSEAISEQVAALPGITDLSEPSKTVIQPSVISPEENKAGMFSRAISGLKNLFKKTEEVDIVVDEKKEPIKERPVSRSSSTRRPTSTIPKRRETTASRANNKIASQEKPRKEKVSPEVTKEKDIVKQDVQRNAPVTSSRHTAITNNTEEQTSTVKVRRQQRQLTQSVRLNKKLDNTAVNAEIKENVKHIIEPSQTHVKTAPVAVEQTVSITPSFSEALFEKSALPKQSSKITTTETNNLHVPTVPAVVETSTTAELTQSPVTPERVETRRSRRSPRHLRLTSQRRRRSENQLKSPMPLSFAMVSPEFASGKVWLDPTAFHQRISTMTDNNSDHHYTMSPNNTIDEPSANTIQQTEMVPHEALVLTNTISENIPPIELITIQKEVISDINVAIPMDENMTVLGYASSPMAKPNKTPYIHVEPKHSNWIRPPFDFSGKGAAGAHSAESCSYSETNKPNSI